MPKRTSPEIEILHVDDALIAVAKPAGMLVVPDRAGRGGMLQAVRDRLSLPPQEDLRIVHRLDRQTSGALLVARGLEAQRALTEQFQNRRVDKRYLALVRAQPAVEAGVIDKRIAKAGRAGLFRVDPAGKRAITKWRVAERFSGFCLLECKPLTGRTHQIRVHLQAADMPLAVDPTYGGAEAVYLSQVKPRYKPSSRKPESPLIDRVTLHAWRLAVRHPRTDEVLRIEAPLPPDFERTLRQLRKWGKS